jgi:hypothetical protein
MKKRSAAAKPRPFAYASIIEALTVGLYPNRKHVLREFVQNAYDGLVELKRLHPEQSLHPVEISINSPSLIIADKGIGMDRDKMHEYRYLGYSEKQPGTHAGFRGIGKFSPVSTCERIIVRSSKLGETKKYEVVIEAAEMLNRHKKEKNPPLEEVLEKHTTIQEADEKADEHYTFVEFYGIKPDSLELLHEETIHQYLRRVAPVPLDPRFSYAQTINEQLRKLIPNFVDIDVKVNGKLVHKPYIENHSPPQFETIYADDSFSKLIAFSWYCGNLGRGQFQQEANDGGKSHRHPDSGLSFRVSNFTVGDQLLTRRALWTTTPERAYYFFGEIHVLDTEVLPTSDRDNFEENESRKRLYEHCRKISQDLNVRANLESTERRFGEVVANGRDLIAKTEKALKTGALENELKDDKDYEIRKLVEDLKKRLQRSNPKDLKDKGVIRRAKQIVRKGETVRKSLKGDGKTFFAFVDIKKDLKLKGEAAAVYDTIIDVLKEEFEQDKEKFADLVRKVHMALRKSFPC